MNKKRDDSGKLCLKIRRIMKITTMLLILGIIHVSATTYAQEQRISVEVENGTFYDIVSQIEKQSEFMFFYKSDEIDNSQRITLKADDKLVSDILNEVVKNRDLNYKITGKHIIIAKSESITQSTKRISGVVNDENGEPIIGANVTVKGTTTGTVTDLDGKFVLDVPQSALLVISYIGYTNKEVTVGNTTIFNITLGEDTQNLSEVVVVGYGVQRKSDLTGSVANVKAETLMERPATTVEQALAGRVAGVNISTNSGRPGGRTSVRIRGISSINASSNPLYVVDGVVWEGGGLDAINPNDIETIDVLKDASSTAIYGTRGSNGVIIISTKRGGKGQKAQVNYDANVSVSQLARKIDVLNSAEFMHIWEEGYKNASKYDPTGFANGKYANVDPAVVRERYKVGNSYGNREIFDTSGNPLYDTDWQDEATRTAISHNHNLSVSGGTEKTAYGIFLNYTDDQGIIESTYKKRFSARMNIETEVRDWLKFGTMMSFSDIKGRVQDNEQGSGNIPRTMIENVPILPVKWSDGTYAQHSDMVGLEQSDSPSMLADGMKWLEKSSVFNGNVYANITFMKGLDLRTTLGASNTNVTNTTFSPTWVGLYSGRGKAKAQINTSRRRFWQWENHLTYTTKINDIHSINAMVGAEYQKYHFWMQRQ